MSLRRQARGKSISRTIVYCAAEASPTIKLKKTPTSNALVQLEHTQAITATTGVITASKKLITKVSVMRASKYSSSTIYKTEFHLWDPVETPYLAGSLQAQMIDRQKQGLSKKAYLTELLDGHLERPMSHASPESNIDETQTIMRHLFNHNGTPRAEYETRPLGSGNLHYIAEFELDDEFRGPGLAQIAMNSYHEAIQHLPGQLAFRGTVVLSPAALRGKFAAKAGGTEPAKTFVEIEHALIDSYRKSGYKVWSKADDALEGSGITIMGRTVGELTTASRDLAVEAIFPPYARVDDHSPEKETQAILSKNQQESRQKPGEGRSARKETGVKNKKLPLRRKVSKGVTTTLDRVRKHQSQKRHPSLLGVLGFPESQCWSCGVAGRYHKGKCQERKPSSSAIRAG